MKIYIAVAKLSVSSFVDGARGTWIFFYVLQKNIKSFGQILIGTLF